ncbi:Domain of unknown function DUF2088 [Moorella glycerini]|uniref:LarA-like N-terminal domain-containing protein n=1 Tax=Neomoorella stamsii TaxID=1266720 RepID=A0A9X7P7R9_9FIRM|nr:MULTISPECIES: nickel-dependent lactate racemase [Moorella]PRR77567.1 hypothetical protein MOST_01640 [Moorella stamsii]CEP69386.1 Domain of unknown function DUF2088 [Moorella glycerini]
MTRITFSNPFFSHLDIEANIVADEYHPVNTENLSLAMEEEIIKAGLDNPIGTPALVEMLSPDQKVLIIVDDNTRTTPVNRILPYLLAELKAAGISDANIKFLVGLGTHRHMEAEELKLKLGIEIYQYYSVYNHDWQKQDALINIGKTASGIDIWINRHLTEADFIIGIGHIVPHRVAGYSGGGKIIQPGVCGPITTGQTHWLSAYYSAAEILGHPDNPIRREIEEVAIRAGLKFIINVVQDKTGRLVGVFAGDPIKAHRQGCALAQKIYGVSIKAKADIVITEAFPAELELWQATKALQAADIVVNSGGVIILLAECPEGISKSHGQLILKYGFRPLPEVENLIARQEITNLNVASYLARVGNIVNRVKVILVSRGIAPAEARVLGFEAAATPQEAWTMALGLAGQKARLAVLHHGSEILPVL